MITLDTDVMVDLLRRYPPALAWSDTARGEKAVLSGLVVMEVIEGCSNLRDQERVQRELSGYLIAWPSEQSCQEALRVFTQSHLSRGLGIIDALIGQTAVQLGAPLYTFNEKYYACIPGLRVVKPYEKLST